MIDTILWRRIDLPGHEISRIDSNNGGWSLSGTAIFSYNGDPCNLNYRILCDPNWRTISANIIGQIGEREVELTVQVDQEQRWRLNGIDSLDVTGCIDIDLGFSPSTNLLPIRRLSLAVGEWAEVQAAWLPFPTLSLERLPQTYNHTEEMIYEYEANDGDFTRILKVNECGFVTSYPGLWQMEPAI